MKKIEAIIRKSNLLRSRGLHKVKSTSLVIGTSQELETKRKVMCIEELLTVHLKSKGVIFPL